MGTILASAIIDKAETILQDTTNIRWPALELLGWLNDGQREVASIYPDLTATIGNITLVVGTRQTLPANAIALLKVIRNMGTSGTTPGNAIRKVPQELLDAGVPAWHTGTAVTALQHYIYDPRAPRTFYVYPPSIVANQVEALYSVSPPDLASLAIAIGIDDIYQNALIDYVLYRAYSKDMETVGNTDRAIAHRGAFDNYFMTKKAVDVALQPVNMVKG